jgi:hypothetical protein
MPSPDQGSVDLPILTFGGRVTQYDPQGLPMGASPFCQDVSFSGIDPSGAGVVSGVCTRPGMKSFYATSFGGVMVNYLKTFVDTQAIYHLLSMDSQGNLRDESPCPTPPGVPNIFGTVVLSSLAQSDSFDNREWMAISSPVAPGFGIDIPRQWDGQKYRRVSQSGPGAGPTVIDNNSVFDIEANGLSQFNIVGPPLDVANNTSFVATLLLEDSLMSFVGSSTAFPSTVQPNLAIQVNDFITNVGYTPSQYNGTFQITEILLDANGNLIGIQFILPVDGISAPATGGTTYFGLTKILADGSFVTGPPTGNITVQASTDAAYNGVWPLRYIFPPAYTGGGTTYPLFVQLPVQQLAVNSTGNIIEPGHVVAGLHGVSVGFITDQQYFTKPSPPVYWTAGGSLQALLSGIPTGPSNIIGRYLVFTPVITPPATQGPFFFYDGPVTLAYGTYPSMVINDNTTTVVQLDFDDSTLENAEAATNLFNLLVLGEVSHFTEYSGRLFACGERNKLPNLLNMDFDGGFFGNTPTGWTTDAVNGAGGSSSPNPYYGGGYRITGDGVFVDQGLIYQAAAVDYLGVSILSVATAYSVRVRLTTSDVFGGGTFIVQAYSPTLGVLGAFQVLQVNMPDLGNYLEFIGPLMLAHATIPADTRIGIFVSGQAAGFFIDVDCVEVFPTNTPYNNTQLRGSYALDPESFDQSTGFQNVGPENGFPITSVFNLLDGKLYIVTALGLYSTQDDGQNEPDLWAVPQVSATMGTPSSRGVGVGESWAIIAHKTGAYIFWGSEPVKITQEIEPDWNLINWAYGNTIYVLVDTRNKRIHIGAPTNGSTVPNVEFVCDYAQLANAEGSVSAQDIAAHPQAYYSVYNPTKVVAPGKARKWTLWNLSMNCATLAIRSDGSYHLLRGTSGFSGKVYDQVTSQTSDDGVAINSQYQTAFFPQIEDEQMLQLGSHRKLMKYLTGYASGAGIMNWYIYGAQGQRGLQLSNLTLQSPAKWDFEKNMVWVGERASLLFGTNAVGSWFKLVKLCPTLQKEIITPVRGTA